MNNSGDNNGNIINNGNYSEWVTSRKVSQAYSEFIAPFGGCRASLVQFD